MNVVSCPEFFDAITTDNLKEVLEDLKETYKRRKKGHPLAIFEHDINEDLTEIKRRIEAFKLVLAYYGVKA
jgi:hypothetical protein